MKTKTFESRLKTENEKVETQSPDSLSTRRWEALGGRPRRRKHLYPMTSEQEPTLPHPTLPDGSRVLRGERRFNTDLPTHTFEGAYGDFLGPLITESGGRVPSFTPEPGVPPVHPFRP